MAYTKELNFVIIAMALTSLVLVGTAITQSYGQNEKYRAKLDGDNEVPPVNTTAEGVINFKTKDGSMSWKMNITGITDPTGAHIHKARNGTNGDVVVDLLKVSKHSSNPQGIVMRGNITDSSLTGPMKGQTLKDLQTAMANGDTYVNVHTKDHPNGEIRGQIKLKGDNATSVGNTTSTGTTS
jgi:CHRD domain